MFLQTPDSAGDKVIFIGISPPKSGVDQHQMVGSLWCIRLSQIDPSRQRTCRAIVLGDRCRRDQVRHHCREHVTKGQGSISSHLRPGGVSQPAGAPLPVWDALGTDIGVRFTHPSVPHNVSLGPSQRISRSLTTHLSVPHNAAQWFPS